MPSRRCYWRTRTKRRAYWSNTKKIARQGHSSPSGLKQGNILNSIITHQQAKASPKITGRRATAIANGLSPVGNPVPRSPLIGNPLPLPRVHNTRTTHENDRPSTAVRPYHVACERSRWTVWSRDIESDVTFTTPFRCHSWRHEGDCSRWANAQAFVRIRDAVKRHDTPPVYMVLTVDPKRFGLLGEAYTALCGAFQRFRQRLEYRLGKIDYCSLVEQHKSGFPHMNVLIHNYPMYDAVTAEADLPAQGRPFKGWVERVLVECGLGSICWMEAVRSEEAIAGYFTKLIAETAKVLQLPVNAPDGFRRLRASRGYLPMTHAQERRLKGGRVGGLVRFPADCIEVSERIQLTNRGADGILIARVHSYSEDGDAKHQDLSTLPMLRQANKPCMDEEVPSIPPVGVEKAVFTAEH